MPTKQSELNNMDRYQKIEKNGHVGEGTYGVVYKAKDKQTDEIVALKVLDCRSGTKWLFWMKAVDILCKPITGCLSLT